MTSDKSISYFEPLWAELNYNPVTGVFIWTKGKHGRSGIGTRAGGVSGAGYRMICFLGYKYYEHRLAWLNFYGEWPDETVDHINHNRADNRIVNLRQATQQQQCMNQSLSRANKFGYRGVSWHDAGSKYQVTIRVKGKSLGLGLFVDVIAAAKAYDDAARDAFGEYANLNFPESINVYKI